MGKAHRVRPLTLDAGALVAIERQDRVVRKAIQVALDAGFDVVDASVAVCARSQRGSTVLTSDPADIRRLDADLDVEAV